jgi:peroxiredoxin
VQGIRVLGITTDPFEEAARAAQAFGFNYPVLADREGDVTRSYQARALPVVFVVDKRASVRAVMLGVDQAQVTELERLVKALALE